MTVKTHWFQFSVGNFQMFSDPKRNFVTFSQDTAQRNSVNTCVSESVTTWRVCDHVDSLALHGGDLGTLSLRVSGEGALSTGHQQRPGVRGNLSVGVGEGLSPESVLEKTSPRLIAPTDVININRMQDGAGALSSANWNQYQAMQSEMRFVHLFLFKQQLYGDVMDMT